jgi:Predicted glycosyltransferases
MEPLKISIVVPTYKRPRLLLRCLEALLHQDFPLANYEIIIVSDGADAVTTQALEAIRLSRFPSVRYYSLPAKFGPATARNLGWMLAQAELVAFTDDDCIPAKGWLSAMWASCQEQRKKEIAFSGSTLVPLAGEPTDYERNISQLATAEFITANCACTREALQRVGGFDERFRMAWREDSDLQFKFILNDIPIVKVMNALVTHPVRKAPWGISIREERKGMFNALLYKKYPRLYKEKIEPSTPWHYYLISVFLLLFVAGVLTEKPFPKILGLSGWLVMTSWFATRRLRKTSHSFNHVSEMIFTSAVIPVLSLFWKFYGSLKFKVFSYRDFRF